MQTKEFRYKGKKIVYRIKGNGPLLVLLHGFGEDGTIWRAQFDLFPDNQLIVPDLPGTGESERLADMSMEGLAEAVHALVEDIANASSPEMMNAAPASSTKLTLIGHSMGGYITLAFAEKYPHALNAFGLFHSTAFADSEEKRETRRKGIGVMKEKGGGEFLKTFVPGLYSPATKEKAPEKIEEHLATVRNVDDTAIVEYFEAMMQRPDRTEVLRNSQVPVLFVMGRYDKAVPFEDVLKQCHLPQMAYIHLPENSAHCGMVEEAEEAAKILVQFVTTVENRT